MKIENLRQDFAPGLEGVRKLTEISSARNLLSSLSENRNINKYKKKQIIYLEGNRPNRLFYVVKGKVKTYKTNEDGKELVIELYSHGDFLGHIALLEESAYKDTAEALEETELALIPKEDFEELINNNKEISHQFIRLLAKNISEKENHLLGLAYNSLRKKVAEALITLQKKYQTANDQKFVIEISRENLATIAGTATESLIRTLSEFRHENLIEIKDGNIIITNQKKLEYLVN